MNRYILVALMKNPEFSPVVGELLDDMDLCLDKISDIDEDKVRRLCNRKRYPIHINQLLEDAPLTIKAINLH